MAPVTNESSNASQLNGDALAGGKAQAAAAEIAVTVNGARTIAGTDKREPFSENTSTVLVFSKGAVIRLASAVAAGQLLFLTNEKTKKEVVCQVVKSKNANLGGYVELEFTEPAASFWGMRFPGSLTSAPPENAAKPSAAAAVAPMKPLEEKSVEARKTAPDAAQPAENQSASGCQAKDSQPVGPLPAQQKTGAPGIPTLSEFLTQGAGGPTLKTTEKAKAEIRSAKTEATAQVQQIGTELQAQLTARLFTAPSLKPDAAQPSAPPVNSREGALPARQPDQRESLSALLIKPPAKENPAPGASSFDFGGDEVRIPAWLEPLARNSGSVTPMHETKAHDSAGLTAKFLESDSHPARRVEVVTSDVESKEVAAPDASPVESSEENVETRAAEFTLSSQGPTPNFGSSLALDRNSDGRETAKGSSKALIFGLLAAVLLLAALAGWYWYSNQPKEVSANSGAPEKTEPLSPATTSSTSGSIDPTPFNAISGSDASRSATNLPGARSDGKGMVATSSGYSRPVIPTPNIEELPHRSAEAAKKPSIGKVHLAAPVVNRSSASDSGSESLPAIEGNAAVGMDAGNLKLLVGKSNQPAAPPAPPAPVPAGGDLKQARLLSSVAPIYPQLARNQRVSGDVRIDALIDVNGRVTATKVVSGPALLYQSAIDAVRQWKYQPATLNGKPMAMHLTITVQFKM